jgi:IS30 family transposase
VLPWDADIGSYRWTTDARLPVFRLMAARSGKSLQLDRAPSSIAREIKRNRSRQAGYKPNFAQQQTRARRWTGSRLERETGLRQTVLDRLAQGWSPEQIAGRLARENGRKIISYETIYRFIYAQIARHAIGRMRRFIPRKTDLANLPNARFRSLVAAYNNTPRKCLDWRTPAEAFSQVLHFECESTSPLSRGRAGRPLSCP